MIKAELENTAGFRIVTTERIEVSKSDQEKNSKIENGNYLVIATLIVTVTFAPGFAIPGGYESKEGNKEGMAVLNHKSSFIIFMVSDLLALAFSTSAVLMQFKLQTAERYVTKAMLNENSKNCIIISMTAMLIAFVSGVYAVVSSPVIKVALYSLAILWCLSYYYSARIADSEKEKFINQLARNSGVIPIRACGRILGTCFRFKLNK